MLRANGPTGPIRLRTTRFGLPPRRLDADSLFELVALVEQLTKPEQKG